MPLELRQLIRACVLSLAVGCALVFEGTLPAGAQQWLVEGPNSHDVGEALRDPNWCWIRTGFETPMYSGRRITAYETTQPYKPDDSHINRITEHDAFQTSPFGPGGLEVLRRKGEIITIRTPPERGLGGVRWDRVPCPPILTPYYSNNYHVGISLDKQTSYLTWLESLAGTGQTTDQGKAAHDPLGVGFNIGYGFTPWGNNIVVSPFVSFDFPNTSVKQYFPGGSFLGTRSNFEATAGVKIGPTINLSTWVYGIAGVSALNETLNINFIPLASSTTQTVPGAMLGVGAAIRPGFLQGFGHPVSLSLEYQHTWWQTAHYNTPAASAPFNYAFQRQDDTVKVGFNVYFSAPPPAAPPQSNMALKAPPSR
jgi:hypothetical protein